MPPVAVVTTEEQGEFADGEVTAGMPDTAFTAERIIVMQAGFKGMGCIEGTVYDATFLGNQTQPCCSASLDSFRRQQLQLPEQLWLAVSRRPTLRTGR